MCACSPEGQPYPGLHQERGDQKVEGADSARLLCSCETPPEVLCPVLRPPAQEHRIVGVDPEEGHKDDQRAGAPPLQGQAERLEALQHGEEKAPGGPYGSLPVPERGLKESWGGNFYKGR